MDISDETMDFDFSSQNGENKNTKRKTETDMRIFSAYILSLNEPRPIEALPPAELDRYLTTFFSVIKKHDGNEYEPASLRGMLCSVERFLRSKNYPSSVTRDVTFLNTRNMLKEKQKVLKEIAKTQKKTKPQDALTSSTVERLKQLYNAKEFGPYSPTAIINSLCFAFVIHLKIRKAVDHKQLLWGDITLKSNGVNEYLCYEPLQGFDYIRPKLAGISQFRIYGQNNQDNSVDPIYIYKLYASKRPHTMMSPDCPFYLGIALVCNSIPPQQQWFKPCPMGVNKLSDLVRMIRDITGSLSLVPGDQYHMDHENLSNEIRETSLTGSDEDQLLDEIEGDHKAPGGFEIVERDVKHTTQKETTTDNLDVCLTKHPIDNDECLTKPADDKTLMQKEEDIGDGADSPRDSSQLDHVKRTITECLHSLDDSGKSEILKWLSTLETDTDRPTTPEVDKRDLHVTFSLTPSQLRSGSPFTICANVTRSKPEAETMEDMTSPDHQDTDSDTARDMTRDRINDVIKLPSPPPAHSYTSSFTRPPDNDMTNSILRKRTLSESVLRNTKYLKDNAARRVSADDDTAQPETARYEGLAAQAKQTLPVHPFEFSSLYPPWQAIDPRLALIMRQGLIAGYQTLVNKMETSADVTKQTE